MALPMQDQNFQQDQIRTPNTLTKGHRYAYIVSAVAALGGLLFGYDTGVISGALLYLNPAFHLNSTSAEIAVSAILIGAILGAAAGGRMADTLGRKKSLIILGIIRRARKTPPFRAGDISAPAALLTCYIIV